MENRIGTDICKRTKEARKGAGYIQETMAEAMGLDRGTYKQYELRTPIPYEYIERFCRLTGSDISWLMTGRYEGKTNFSPTAIRILRLMEKQSPAKQKSIIGLLEGDN